MTREEFIEKLDREGYSYREEEGKIAIYVDRFGDADFKWDFPTLPSNIVFKNKGDIYLKKLEDLPPGTVFKNGGSVYFQSLTSLSPDVEFKNRRDINFFLLKSVPSGVKFENKKDVISVPSGVKFENKKDVIFRSASTIPPGVIFKNGGSVSLESLIGWPWFGNWPGSIKEIDPNRILNKMISDGLFDRRI